LDALLGTVASEAPGEAEIRQIPVAMIDVNPRQPRREFDQEALRELAASLKGAGMLQPVLVRPTSQGRWELIAGERRWRAAKMAGLEVVPAVVREATDAESLQLALIENLLREDLNPLEEAEAYQRCLTEFGWTQEELARRLGRDRSTIANTLRLLRLPAPIQEDLRAGRLTMGHARALLALATPAEQLRLRDEILAHAWSVRETEIGVSRRAPARRRKGRSPELAALEAALQRVLATRVTIRGNDQRGRIEIAYGSVAELNRLAAALGVQV
jgi:ParB family chromosome partitioning protein